LHFSGVLAVVAAGLVRGRYSPVIVSAEMRIMARSVWNLLVFLLNSVVFMLIGLQMSDVVRNLDRYPPGQVAAIVSVVTAAAVLVRFAWVFAIAWLPEALGGSSRDQQAAPAPQRAVHHRLVRHARHRVAGGGAVAAAHAAGRRAVPAP
jgi:NhaP-type Na+/H+ or K+/H+ antiporter